MQRRRRGDGAHLPERGPGPPAPLDDTVSAFELSPGAAAPEDGAQSRPSSSVERHHDRGQFVADGIDKRRGEYLMASPAHTPERFASPVTCL